MINVGRSSLVRPRFQPGSAKAYIVAGLIAATATALHVALDSWLTVMPFVTFFPAVILAAFLCGSRAGFFAALSSAILAWTFAIPSGFVHLAIYQTALFGVGAVTVVAVIGAMRSATADIQHLNDSLRISEAKFRALVESAPDAMIVTDEQRRIALINARAEDLFGYDRAALAGQPIDGLMPEASHATYLAELLALLSNPDTAPQDRMIELDGKRKDGDAFPIELSFGHIRTESGLLVFNAIRDITARRQIEAKLAEASKAKSDFLANVSHELRTPLNAIIGFSELIRDAVVGPLDARYREYGGDINDSGRHLQNIINDILDISKIERGRLELRDEIVSIGEMLESCRRIVEAMAATAGVSLSVEAPGNLPLVHADQLRLRQVLLNLMSNAVKFTPSGGRVSVSAVTATGGAVIVVKDTGIGMKEEDIAIALQPFRQIDGALSRRFGGTGLGLPLAKALVELHGGHLDLESAPGAGTTVRIQLPAERLVNAAA